MMCNKLAISLSPTSKIRLLDECNTENKLALVRKIQTCSFCNIVGDNLDIRVQPRIQSSHHKVQDCHYFGILVFFFQNGSTNREHEYHTPSDRVRQN